MRFILLFLFSLTCVYADTIDRYMHIVDNIPKMEMTAEPDAHIWVRSARNVLNLTSESIFETLMLANKTVTLRGIPLFCIPGGTTIDAAGLNQLIQHTYRNISSPESEKNKMTVSEVALLGLTQKYPCTQQGLAATQTPVTAITSSSQMQHASALDAAQGFRP